MANLNFEGIGARAVTMKAATGIAFERLQAHGTQHAGKAVKISANGEVDLVGTGEKVWGKLLQVEPDGYCSVQCEGFCELPTDGTAITYGGGLVGGATAGTVKTGVTERVLAIHSNATGKVYAHFC